VATEAAPAEVNIEPIAGEKRARIEECWIALCLRPEECKTCFLAKRQPIRLWGANRFVK